MSWFSVFSFQGPSISPPLRAQAVDTRRHQASEYPARRQLRGQNRRLWAVTRRASARRMRGSQQSVRHQALPTARVHGRTSFLYQGRRFQLRRCSLRDSDRHEIFRQDPRAAEEKRFSLQLHGAVRHVAGRAHRDDHRQVNAER